MNGTYSFWDTFSNDGNRFDLWEFHELHSRTINTAGGSKVHDGVHVGVLGHSLLDTLVDWQQCLAGSPVHLADELTAKCVDNTSDRRSGSLADEVKVKHALDSSWLQTVDEASCLVVEECMFSSRAQGAAWSSKSTDVVVGRPAFSGGRAIGGRFWCSGRHDGQTRGYSVYSRTS